MDPRSRLTNGQVAAREGRFADALREYVWFHDHALEHQPSLYGVRLSFALGYWMELAEQYPEAKTRLEEIRGRKTVALAFGEGDRSLFHDVKSINEALGAEGATYELFLRMIKVAPKLAGRCADIAMDSIIGAKDFALAEEYSPDPETSLLLTSDRFNADVANLRGMVKCKARRLGAYIHIYCDHVNATVAILKGLGKLEEAQFAREWAVVLVESKPVRIRVQRKLYGAETDRA
jgi:hypothetical protein